MREKGVPPVVDTILFLLVDISRHLRSRLSSNRVARLYLFHGQGLALEGDAVSLGY